MTSPAWLDTLSHLCPNASTGSMVLKPYDVAVLQVKSSNRVTRELLKKHFDEDKSLVEYVKAVIKGWKGLKYSYLEELLLVDISTLNPDDELEFNQDNAETLMKNASDFDTWVSEVTGDLENFTKTK